MKDIPITMKYPKPTLTPVIPKNMTSRLATEPTSTSIQPMNLPAPRDTICDCIWLPRIRAKAQLYKSGNLPEAYIRPFCLAPAADGQLLKHFQTDKDALLSACDLPDSEFDAWFRGLPGNSDAHIAAWNEIAVNLGRPGYPMEERFPWALDTLYPELKPYNPQCVFDMIEYDEGFRSK